MPFSDIRVHSLSGPELHPYLHSIAKLRIEIFREFPYLDEGSLGNMTSYMQKFPPARDSIGVLVFDKTTLIGASTGLPLSLERPEVQASFLEKNLALADYFFFSESVLLKPYRQRGIGHHFFDLRENHVQNLKKFKHICFCFPNRPENHPQKPSEYMPLNDFWRKRGFVKHPDLQCTILWQDIGEKEPSGKKMSFWVKDI